MEPEFIEYKNVTIIYEPRYNEYYIALSEWENNHGRGYKSLIEAKKWIDIFIKIDEGC